MKTLNDRSIVFRQGVFIIGSATLLLMVIFSYIIYRSSRDLSSEIDRSAASAVISAAHELDQTFQSVELAANVLAVAIEKAQDDADKQIRLLEQIQSRLYHSNETIYGGCISYLPGAHVSGEKHYMIYVYFNEKGEMITSRQPESYDYFNFEWFAVPLQNRRAHWAEPYFDEGAGNILMTTYTVPIYRDGTLVGMVTVDLSLKAIDEMVKSLKVRDEGHGFLVSPMGIMAGGDLLTHEKDTKGKEMEGRLTEMVFDDHDDTESMEYFDGVESNTLYHAHLPTCNWVLGFYFPTNVLYADSYRLAGVLSLIGVIGMLALFVVTAVILKKIAAPLTRLTDSVREFGHGMIDVKLPQYKFNDEIGQLTKAFAKMRKDIEKYILELAESTASQERIESEIAIARDIQADLLPRSELPAIFRDKLSLNALLNPAKTVGGDLYDFFGLGDDKLCIIIGDVSGKGVPAALFMAITQTLHRSEAGRNDTPGEIVARVNTLLAKNNEMMMFVTYWLGILDSTTGELAFSNAGHNPPFLLHTDGSLEEIDALHGPALGVRADLEFGSAKIKINHGDSLFLYTDGITEAMNCSGEFFGLEKLREILTRISGQPELSTEQKSSIVLQAVRNFTGNAEQSDDITMLFVDFK